MLEVKRGKTSFYVGKSEEDFLAEMTYVLSGEDKLIIDHTYVSEELKGQGVGRLLLDELVGWARTEGKKIIPLCPYAKGQTEKYEMYKDILY